MVQEAKASVACLNKLKLFPQAILLMNGYRRCGVHLYTLEYSAKKQQNLSICDNIKLSAKELMLLNCGVGDDS